MLSDELVEEYSYGKCMWFALAVHEKFGWPIEALLSPDGDIEHVWARTPSGNAFDIAGPNGADDFIQCNPYGVRLLSRNELIALVGSNEPEVAKARMVLDTMEGA